MHFSEQAVVLVPTLNPGKLWERVVHRLLAQTPAPSRIVVLDSASTDGSLSAAAMPGVEIYPIEQSKFTHGGTRQQGIDLFCAGASFVVFLTQDAVLADPHAVEQLLSGFSDPSVAAVYGRQKPHPNANAMAKHAREFNYTEQSQTLSWSDKDRLGFKACFLSNAFAAYRLSALQEVGGFSDQVILGEDTHLAARLQMAGYAVRYQANAIAYHSHNYSLAHEFARYFDTGVFHHEEHWMIEQFGGVGKEGLKFLRSEFSYLWRQAPWQLPEALIRTVCKALAYRLGRSHARLPLPLKKRLSMHKGFWA